VAFQRVVNTPVRGIGKTSVSKLIAWADRQGVSPLEAARAADKVPKLTARAVKPLQHFAAMIDELAHESYRPVAELLTMILNRTGYTRQWHDGTEQDMQRVSNVEELVTAARQYDETAAEPSLTGFLETASLAQELDNVNASAGQVTLMTLHAAKGLEFPFVYVVAVEQNLIPHERSLRDNAAREIEEERRLLFVGMTRAMQHLVLTQTRQREFRGRNLATIPSPFLQELPYEFHDCTTFDSDEFEESQVPPGGDWDDVEPIPERDEEAADEPAVKDTSAAKPRLMSGADLLNGTATAQPLPVGFRVGMLVRHPRYGLGTVIDLGGYAKRRTVTVRFETDDRQETFIAAKCPLQPVGVR
jgi:DNA helicase-2/ATP-dependent DNA helicase PcrA